MMEWRTEHDLLGAVEVPEDALFGAQTQRALHNFVCPAGGRLGDFPELTTALIGIKKAAAQANQSVGQLASGVAHAIVHSAEMLVQSEHDRHFPIHALHGGGGTSANMNTNEVLANLAEEHLGGRRGEYRLVHPNDHVNLNQSTNDVYPTACHVAIITRWQRSKPTFARLIDVIDAKAEENAGQDRLARTCLQDATVISTRDFLSGYASLIERGMKRIAVAVDALYAVNLGGTVVGRADMVPAPYFDAIVPALANVFADSHYRRAYNLYDTAQNPDDMVAVSAAIELMARGLIKIAADLRLLNSGPEGGLGELRLAAVQPGSSMMPGKVNPVVPEFVIQLCFSIVGNHAACVLAVDHGELDLNIWESAVVSKVLESMAMVDAAAEALASCLQRMSICPEPNERHSKSIIPLLTELMQTHGYSTVNAVCKSAGFDPCAIRAALADRRLFR